MQDLENDGPNRRVENAGPGLVRHFPGPAFSTSFSFCLTSLFFRRLLQVSTPSKDNVWRLLKLIFCTPDALPIPN